MKKCSSCGFLVNDDVANFCPECGNPLIPVSSPESIAPADPAPIVNEFSSADDNGSADPVSQVPEENAAKPSPADLGIVYTGYIPEAPEEPAQENNVSGNIFLSPDLSTDTNNSDTAGSGEPISENEPEAVPDNTLSAAASAVHSNISPIPVMPSAPSTPVEPAAPSAQSYYTAPETPAVSPAENPIGYTAPAAPAPAGNTEGYTAPAANDTSSYSGPQPVENTPPVRPGQLSREAIIEILDRNTDMTAKVLGSAWFVIAMIGFVIATCTQLVNSVVTYIDPFKSSDYKWLIDAFNEFDIDFIDFIDEMNRTRIPAMIVSIVCMIPVVFSCIGMVRMYIAHKKRPVPYSGTTMAKTNLVFKLIIASLAAIATLCVLIASFILGEELLDYEYLGYEITSLTAFRIVLVVITVILITIFLCFIFYYIGMLKTLTVIKKAGWEGKCPRNRVSIYAAVINIVAAVFMTIAFVSSVTSINGLSSILNVIVTFGLMLYFLGAGMAMFRLKDSLTELPGIK